MFLFLLKKSFFDAWDNLYRMVLVNLAFLLSLCLAVALPVYSGAEHPLLFSLAAAPGYFLFVLIYSFSVAYLGEVSGFRSTDIKEAWLTFKSRLRKTLIFAAVNLAVIIVVFTASVFYSGAGNMFGLIGGAVIFWILLFGGASVQYFMPLMYRFDEPMRKTLRKSAIMFLDNSMFSILCLIFCGLLLLLSVATVFLLFGIGSIVLFQLNMLRLRMYKYDYLEEHEGLGRRDVPWDQLLEEDRESVGPRSIKGMIFPWK